MIDRLHTLIGQTANFATQEEGVELLRIAADNDARFLAITEDKKKFNKLLQQIKWREERKKRGIKKRGVRCKGRI